MILRLRRNDKKKINKTSIFIDYIYSLIRTVSSRRRTRWNTRRYNPAPFETCVQRNPCHISKTTILRLNLWLP